MGAQNTTAEGTKTFYKLKEDKTIGEYRFFKQVKQDKWIDGESFNQLSGEVVGVEVTEYVYDGQPKKQLIVKLTDVADKLEFSCGLATMVGQGICNTIAGGNGFDLSFTCGKPKQHNGKSYPTLYINAGTAKERTNWKFQPQELPKITKTKDEDGNLIKKGVKQAENFWLAVVEEIQEQLKSPRTVVKEVVDKEESAADSSDLPY